MYEWLTEEIAQIKNRKFHLTHQKSFEGRRPMEIDWPCSPPPSFQKFIEQFGSVSLYRELSYYLIRVCSLPTIWHNKAGDEFFSFGGYASGSGCFKKSLLREAQESPVFETRGFSGLFQTAKSFDEWLLGRAKAARKHYKRLEWDEILRGPPPFTADEADIVAARNEFKWKVVGVNENRELLFEVTNNSKRTLPFLSVGIRSPKLLGAISVPVHDVAPGNTRIVSRDAYKDLVNPHEVQAYELPEPWPEDRERYWEFKGTLVAGS